MQEALREEKDMAILSYFVQTRLPLHAMSDDEKVKRQHCSFNLFGQRVCRKSFLFAYDIRVENFYFLLRQYDINGAVPRIHGNKKRLPQNAFSIDVHMNVRSFIENYAEENAVLPGRIPGCKDTDICLLPSAESKHDIWVHYDLSCKKANLTSVSYPVFCKLWKVMTSWIIVSKPMTDLCWKCQSNNNMIYKCANHTEEKKVERLKEQLNHIKMAKDERLYYKNQCQGRFPFRVFSCAGGKFLFESARIFFKEPIRFHVKKPRRKNTRNGKRPSVNVGCNSEIGCGFLEKQGVLFLCWSNALQLGFCTTVTLTV